MTARYAFVHAPVLDALQAVQDECADFVLTDPPYGLGSHEPTPAEILAYLNGAALTTGGDFMGTDWEIPSIAVWREVYRIAKPGAHIFAFGGTRTWDLVSLGLRMAGFTNRDTIAADYPALRWLQAQGFAKSSNLGKKDPALQGKYANLAPTWEPVLVFRKPFQGTLLENVRAHGCGALNIDACRIYTDWNEPDRGEAWKLSGHSAKPDAEKIAAPPGNGIECNPLGRYPKNTVLIHASGCRCVGAHAEKAPVINRWNDGAKPFGGGARHAYTTVQTSPDGLERVEEWECVDGCPIKALNEQAGERKSGAKTKDYPAKKGACYGTPSPLNTTRTRANTGSAARFFNTFAADPPEAPFHFVSKASTREREAGCEALPADENGRRNHGKCVKPQAFLQWLAKLGGVANGLAVVPYAGTGSEVIALARSGMRAIGIERDAKMVEIAEARAEWWMRK